ERGQRRDSQAREERCGGVGGGKKVGVGGRGRDKGVAPGEGGKWPPAGRLHPAAIPLRMFLTRREFLQILAAAASCGLPLAGKPRAAVESAVEIYDLPPSRSAVTLLPFPDCQGQLLQTYYREPDANIGMNEAWGKPPHLVGEALLRHFGIASGSRLAHAYTCLDFEDAARRFGK